MFWINKNIPIYINGNIIEYDIKAGNTSVMREFNIYDSDKITQLEKMTKKDRTIAVGKIMRSDKDFSKKLESGFNTIVERFITENNLDRETDIISIKRDAIFVLNKKIKINKIGHCEFVSKNEYRSYITIPNFEFYIKYDNTIDCKGMSDENFELHKKGIQEFILWVDDICQPAINKMKTNRMMKDFVKDYKELKLNFDLYREFSHSSKYRVHMSGRELIMDSMSNTFISKCDITYNYLNVVMPILRLIC